MVKLLKKKKSVSLTVGCEMNLDEFIRQTMQNEAIEFYGDEGYCIYTADAEDTIQVVVGGKMVEASKVKVKLFSTDKSYLKDVNEDVLTTIHDE